MKFHHLPFIYRCDYSVWLAVVISGIHSATNCASGVKFGGREQPRRVPRREPVNDIIGRAASFCHYNFFGFTLYVTAFAELFRRKDTGRRTRDREQTCWKCLLRNARRSLHTLHIDLMQYTCGCRSCDVWMPREGSRSPFHGRNEIGEAQLVPGGRDMSSNK